MRCPRCYGPMMMIKMKDIVTDTMAYGWAVGNAARLSIP